MATAQAIVDDRPPILVVNELSGYESARFTADEFLRMGDSGALGLHRLELVDGELVEKPMHGTLHGLLHARLMYLLGTAAPSDCVGMGVLSIRLTDRTVRDFDCGLVARGTPRGSSVAPEAVRLAVEISVTTLSVDLDVKSVEYARGGIPIYWVVDGMGEITHVMTQPGPNGYTRRRVVRFAEPLPVHGDTTITIGDDYEPMD